MNYLETTLCCAAGTLLAYFVIGAIMTVKETIHNKRYIKRRKQEIKEREEAKHKAFDEAEGK